jgi:peptidylprolyl isomerase
MRATYPSLDKNYTAFGRVISGLPAIQAIKTGEPVTDPRDTMVKVRMLADIPAAERPKVQVLSTTSPSFKAIVAAAKEKGGGTFSPCDIEIPAKIG